MKKLDRLISKLRLLGESAEILEDDSAIVYTKSKDSIKGYKVDNNKIKEVEYRLIKFLDNTDKYIVAIKGNNTYLLDRHLEPKLKFSGEQPFKLINNYFIVLKNMISRTLRIIGIDGREVTDPLDWSLEVRSVAENKIIVVETNNIGLKVVIGSYENNRTISKTLHDLTIQDKVYVGKGHLCVKYKLRNKLIIYDYENRILLSIPSGTVIDSGEDLKIRDRVSKVIKVVKSADLIYK